jgi:hypothetical protein
VCGGARLAVKNASKQEMGFGTMLLPKKTKNKSSLPTRPLESSPAQDSAATGVGGGGSGGEVGAGGGGNPKSARGGQVRGGGGVGSRPTSRGGGGWGNGGGRGGRAGERTSAPQSATMYAAAGKGDVALVRSIVQSNGVDVNVLDRFGCSALYYAAGGGHAEVTRSSFACCLCVAWAVRVHASASSQAACVLVWCERVPAETDQRGVAASNRR